MQIIYSFTVVCWTGSSADVKTIFVCQPWWFSLFSSLIKKVKCLKWTGRSSSFSHCWSSSPSRVLESFICHHQSVSARSCFVSVYKETVEWIKTQVSFFSFLCFCSETLEEIADYMLPCKTSVIKTSQGRCLPLFLISCNISKIPGCLINGLHGTVQSCTMNCWLWLVLFVCQNHKDDRYGTTTWWG